MDLSRASKVLDFKTRLLQLRIKEPAGISPCDTLQEQNSLSCGMTFVPLFKAIEYADDHSN